MAAGETSMSKSRVHDVGDPKTHGTVVQEGDQVSEVRWDESAPWGRQCFVGNENLREAETGDIPEFLRRRQGGPQCGAMVGVAPATAPQERTLTAQEEFRKRHPITEADERAAKEIESSQKTRSVNRMLTRIEKVKNLGSKPPREAIWDTRRNKWIHPDTRAWWDAKKSRWVHPGESALN